MDAVRHNLIALLLAIGVACAFGSASAQTRSEVVLQPYIYTKTVPSRLYCVPVAWTNYYDVTNEVPISITNTVTLTNTVTVTVTNTVFVTLTVTNTVTVQTPLTVTLDLPPSYTAVVSNGNTIRVTPP